MNILRILMALELTVFVSEHCGTDTARPHAQLR